MGLRKENKMKSHSLLLAVAVVLMGSGLASAQQQYDSLGSPTPRPNQGVSPNKVEPNIPIPDGKSDASKPASRPSETTGISASPSQAGTSSGAVTPGDKSVPARPGTGETPSGLTPD